MKTYRIKIEEDITDGQGSVIDVIIETTWKNSATDDGANRPKG